MADVNIALSIVIPLYNESERIGLMTKGIIAFMAASPFLFEFILVDDASTDDTLAKLNHVKETVFADIGANKGDLKIIHLEKNMKKGGALKAGVLQARGSWVLTLDADMAVSPLQLLAWQEKGWVDLSTSSRDTILIGSREEKESNVHDKFYRRIMGRCFNFFVRLLIGVNFNDTQCGFKLYPVDMAKACFSELVELGWTHDVEILKRALLKGAAIKTLPISWTAIDNSKINPLKDSLVMFLSLLKIRRYLRK